MANPPTTNYGWTKPTVGASDDVWGDALNTNFDGVDSTVKAVSTVANAAYPATNPAGYQTAAQVTAVVPVPSSTTPVMDGTAAVGAGTTYARADHIHPSDTTKYNASNPSGYQTAAQVTAALPVASSTTPLMDGVAAIGTGTTWARADHVHPTDTSGWLGDNRIINGDMRIDARNNGASGTAINAYTIDRWQFGASVASKLSWGRGASSLAGFPYQFLFQSSSAYAVVAGDYFIFQQNIEADMVSDFAWGTANAQPVALSFWAQSSLTGTFGGSIQNYTNNRSYPFSFSLPTASTWTKIVIVIPGDTGGTWVMSGAGGSVILSFSLGMGSTRSGPANAWAVANYLSVPGAVSVVGTNGAGFGLTGVKLEVGSVATPYNRQSLAKSMVDCQRYYCANIPTHAVANSAGVNNYLSAGGCFPVWMRTAPTVAFQSQIAAPSNVGAVSVDTITIAGFRSFAQSGAAGVMAYDNNYTASAEL